MSEREGELADHWSTVLVFFLYRDVFINEHHFCLSLSLAGRVCMHVRGRIEPVFFIIFILAFINMYTTFYTVLKISAVIGPEEAEFVFCSSRFPPSQFLPTSCDSREAEPGKGPSSSTAYLFGWAKTPLEASGLSKYGTGWYDFFALR